MMPDDSVRRGGGSGTLRNDGVDWPDGDAAVSGWTDSYFKRTKAIAARFGDCHVSYAVFMRRPVISAPRLAVEWLQAMTRRRDTPVDIDLRYAEGRWVGAG